jgi:8-amino-7-oxononanoate synthase
VSLLRCSVSAAHTKEQLDHMIEVMAGIGRQLGVLSGPTLRVVSSR